MNMTLYAKTMQNFCTLVGMTNNFQANGSPSSRNYFFLKFWDMKLNSLNFNFSKFHQKILRLGLVSAPKLSTKKYLAKILDSNLLFLFLFQFNTLTPILTKSITSNVTPPNVKPGLCVRLGPIKIFPTLNNYNMAPNHVPNGLKTAVRYKHFL